MVDDGKKLNGNGKAWRTTAIIGISAAVLSTTLVMWVWAGGGLAKQVDQNKNDIMEIKFIYKEIAGEISDIKTDVGILLDRSDRQRELGADGN